MGNEKPPRTAAGRVFRDSARTPARPQSGNRMSTSTVPELTPRVKTHLVSAVTALAAAGVEVGPLAQAHDAEIAPQLAAAVEAAKTSGAWNRVPKGSKSRLTMLLRYLRGEVAQYAADKRSADLAEANSTPGRVSLLTRASVPEAYAAAWEAMNSQERGDFIARAYALIEGERAS